VTQSESGALARRGGAPAWVSIALQAAEWACVLAAVGLWVNERPPEGLVLLATPLWVAAWAWRYPIPLDHSLGNDQALGGVQPTHLRSVQVLNAPTRQHPKADTTLNETN